MKKIVIVAIITISFASCEKFNILHPFKKEKKEIQCPVVTTESIPVVVLTNFTAQYPNVVVDTWFNKDNTGFCASFTVNGTKTLALFNNDGTFVKEVAENHQGGDHKNKGNDDDKGCSCEIEGGD